MAITTNITGRTVNASYDSVKDTFPASAAGSGTLSTVNGLNKQMVGVTTTFLQDIEKGDFIWFTTTDELIEVENVVSDTRASLVRGTATALSGVAYKIVKKNGFRSISWMIDGAAAADINSITYPSSSSSSDSDVKPNGQGGGARRDPILVDSTANANVVYVTGI